MPITPAQIDPIISLLAAAFPAQAGNVILLRNLIGAGARLHDLIRQIREDDPAAWEAVSADWRGAAEEFRQTVDRRQT